MKKQGLPRREFFFLRDTIDLEERLALSLHLGQVLDRVENGRFIFNSATEQKQGRYFVLDPEKGDNSEKWIRSELLDLGAERVCIKGTPFFVPSNILYISNDRYDANADLIEYFFKYRNYRVLQRLRSGFVGALVCFLGAAALVLFSSQALRYGMLLASSIVLAHCLFSLVHFYNKNKKLYNTVTFKKPKRPMTQREDEGAVSRHES